MRKLKNTNIVKQIFGLLHLPVLLALLLASCSNGISGTNTNSNSADGKTYISISAKTASSRSIAPSTDDYSTEKLTDLELTGHMTSVITVDEPVTEPEEISLAQAESLAELSGKSIPIEAGNWLLTLSATLNGVTFYGETRAEIEKGKVNTISFTLTPESSYGGMSITVEFTGEADVVSVSLKKAGLEELLAGAELTPVQGTDGKKSVTFSRSATNEDERLESGSYYLLFEFFGLEGVGILNTVENIVRVKEGITTTAKLTLDLNEIYTITYETNGGEPDTVLTDRYSRKSEAITLPEMKKSGCIFKGWYESSDTDYANPLEYIDSSRASDLTLVAYFEEILSTLYVTARTLADGESDTGNGSEANPFANIQNAIEKIKSYNAADVDYTIVVNGMDNSEDKIALLIEDSSEYDPDSEEYVTSTVPANSILIQGKDGTDDGINGTAYGYVPVVISTTVPVTFKNFKIKPLGYVNGTYNTDGYAMTICSGASVTLSDGFELDGSGDKFGTHSAFGAVYVYYDAVLVMEGNASVHNVSVSGKDSNRNDYGGGIFLDGTLVMNGTSSVYSASSTGQYGGGIYVTSNGKLTMNDSASIGGEGKGCTCSNDGGGVYLASGSEFTMNGGSISYCSGSLNAGAGVWVEGATFTMTGGTIAHNTGSNSRGGGVLVNNCGTFNFTGGTISDNTDYGVWVGLFGTSTYSQDLCGKFNMSGSATIDSSNTVYLYGSSTVNVYAKVTIAGSLTGTSPVATITPQSYTAGTRLLEVSSDSGTTLDAEYSKFTLSDSDAWSITEEGTLKKLFIGTKKPTEAKAVYDIVFSDGSATPYTDGLTLSDDEKAAAIAVIFYKGTGLNSPDSEGNADTTTERTLGVGLAQTKDLWCGDPNGSNPGNAWNVLVEPIICAPNEELYNYETIAGNYTFPDTADKNGSDNLSQIAAYLPTQTDSSNNYYTNDTGTAARYPAFYFGINYKDQTGSHVSGTNYEDNWYLPSIAELLQLGKEVTDVNSAIELCGGTLVKTSSGDNSYDYFSSSQYENYSYCTEAYTMRFDSPLYIGVDEKTSDSIYVLAIREF